MEAPLSLLLRKLSPRPGTCTHPGNSCEAGCRSVMQGASEACSKICTRFYVEIQKRKRILTLTLGEVFWREMSLPVPLRCQDAKLNRGKGVLYPDQADTRNLTKYT